MGSYRDIMRGPELAAEYEKFQAWQRKSREEKQTLYKGLNVNRFTYENQLVYIAPFNQAAKSVFVEVSICASGTPSPGTVALNLGGSFWTVAKPAGATDTVLGSDLFPLKKLAKMTVKERGTLREGDHKSRITGREYKRYNSNAVSVFLGKNNATDGFDDVITAIRGIAGYETFLQTKGNSIRFTPEG